MTGPGSGRGEDPAGGGPSWPTGRGARVARRLVVLAAGLVPAASRDARLREWEAELWQLLAGRAGAVTRWAFVSGVWRDAIVTRMEGWTMDGLLRDLTCGARTLWRAPAFAIATIATLALSIGAGTALFSVVDQTVLSDPPYPDADRLVAVDMLFGEDPGEMNVSVWSYPRFTALREAVGSLDALAGYASRTMTLTDPRDPAILTVEVVTPELPTLLGAAARVGRLFGPDEVDSGAPAMVALVSEAFWADRLGRDPAAVGRRITLDRLGYTVIGVVDASYAGVGGGVDVWLPMAALRAIEDDGSLDDPWNQHFRVLGRLSDGATLEQARSEVAAFGASVVERFPPPPGAEAITGSADVVPLREARAEPGALAGMWALGGAVVLLLLIATANLASLCLARGASRRREAAVRASLGAGRGRIVRQLLTESLMLALVGGAIGVAAAAGGVGLLGRWLTSALEARGARGLQLIDPGALTVDGTVLAFAFLVTAGAGLAFGLLPALQAAATDPATWLRGGQASIGRDRRGLPARDLLLTGQVAVTIVLLAGAAVMMRTTLGLQRVDLGYEPSDLMTAMYALTPADVDAGRDPTVVHADVVEALRALPGVDAASVGEVPMGGPTWRTIVMGSEGRPELIPAMHVGIRLQPVADGHLTLLGADFVEGRDIEPTDDGRSELVAVLSRTAAEELFPDGSPLGRRVQLGWIEYQGRGATVIGVVEDLRLGRPNEGPELQAFLSVRQAARLETGLLVRSPLEEARLVEAVRSVLAERAPDVVLTSVMPIEDRVAAVTARPRVLASLLTAFGIVGLILVSVGLYGSIAYAVARRTREIGLRVSLGAGGASLTLLLLRQGLGFVVVGIALGVVAATRVMGRLEAMAFETPVVDPWGLAAVSGLLLVVAACAALIPARRGLRVDPMSALRSD